MSSWSKTIPDKISKMMVGSGFKNAVMKDCNMDINITSISDMIGSLWTIVGRKQMWSLLWNIWTLYMHNRILKMQKSEDPSPFLENKLVRPQEWRSSNWRWRRSQLRNKKPWGMPRKKGWSSSASRPIFNGAVYPNNWQYHYCDGIWLSDPKLTFTTFLPSHQSPIGVWSFGLGNDNYQSALTL